MLLIIEITLCIIFLLARKIYKYFTDSYVIMEVDLDKTIYHHIKKWNNQEFLTTSFIKPLENEYVGIATPYVNSKMGVERNGEL